MAASVTTFNIDIPRWDQNTFTGRVKHFFNITDPRTLLVSEHELDSAKALVESCRAGIVPPGTNQEQLFYAKKLYDSAFHPDSGEKMNLIGRMSFQVPGGMAITGCMLQFYRTVPAVVFWQWVNQSFNAIVNYTNRNAASPISLKELINGITVTDENDNPLGKSRRAAIKGITQVVVSRVAMAAPGMILLPIIMERLEKYPFMKKIQVLHAPLQTILVGGFLVFMVPVACALFPQRSSIALSHLEPDLRQSIVARHGDNVPYVYFNKGL
ncbi:sideroflexin-2 isoform X4 [Lacerta agilis]|uniref:sideroflexin-2 isoform X4 n=1 Tax=Lacerta agilis TaxID=80427 RepID=UPI001419F643|nr:sideroflexin-2 isoform X4 [Lacerta agilis]